jgi:hemin uptake protein HemP
MCFMLENKTARTASPMPSPQVVKAADLLRDQRELFIEHAGERYRLSLTRNGKLILTK